MNVMLSYFNSQHKNFKNFLLSLFEFRNHHFPHICEKKNTKDVTVQLE